MEQNVASKKPEQGTPVNPDLENKTAFTQKREIMGIPGEIFIGAFALAAFGAFMMISYLGVIMGLAGGLLLGMVILVPVYSIHKDDPEGWMVWLKGLTAPDFLDPCMMTSRKVLLLRWEQDVPEIKPIFETEKRED